MTAAIAQPEDHKKSADVLRAEALEEAPQGHEWLVPVERLRSRQIASAQADILGLFEDLGVDFSKADATLDIEPSPAVLRAIGSLGEVLESYVKPECMDDYVEFDSGPSSRERVMELAMWFLGRLGE
jgi:hypothetical protein